MTETGVFRKFSAADKLIKSSVKLKDYLDQIALILIWHGFSFLFPYLVILHLLYNIKGISKLKPSELQISAQKKI